MKSTSSSYLQVAASGCKWLQVTAKWKLKMRTSCDLNNKKLLGTSALLVVTGALLVVTRS